ncbi:PAP2 superfamily protein [Prauserella sp. Am3]|nr:PAP2 superfamily protein [Prauserella sp. Am3]
MSDSNSAPNAGARPRRPVAAVPLVGAGLAGWLALGLLVAGGRRPTPPDAAVESAALGLPHALLVAFTVPTEAPVAFAVLAVVTAVAARGRRWSVVAVAVVAPAVTITANTWLSKPLFDRWYDDHLAYPSGHTVVLVTTLTVVALATAGTARAVVIVAGAGLTAAAAVGMAGLGYHYVTDVAGGAAFAVAVTTGLMAVLHPTVTALVSGARSPRRPARGR